LGRKLAELRPKNIAKNFLIYLSYNLFLVSLSKLNEDQCVEKIVEIGSPKTFSLDQAQDLLPLVYSITEKAHAQVRFLTSQAEAMKNVPQAQLQKIDDEIQNLIDSWQKKMIRLGAHPKGYWLVDFDNGNGYFCWKFPEKEIKYSHGYQEGFSGRKAIQINIEN
jgi:hypothetical protein